MDQAERLLSILERLSKGGWFRVTEVADEYRVRREAIYRDIRTLKGLGYPITAAGEESLRRYSFPRGWADKCPKITLELREIEAALLAMEQSIRTRRPHRLVRLLVCKLQALHAEAGPPARIRVWQSVVRGAGFTSSPEAGDEEVAGRLLEAIAGRLWCELHYVGMGLPEPRWLRFAPVRIADGTVVGVVGGSNRWEALNLDRVREVRVAQEMIQFNPHCDSTDVTPGEHGGDTLPRIDSQILRLVGLVRMLEAGRRATLSDLAEAFSTTVRTIQRDRTLLETKSYATNKVRRRGHELVEKGDVGFSKAPSLPVNQEERRRLLHVLERTQASTPLGASLQPMMDAIRAVPGNELAVLTANVDQGRASGQDEVFWALLDSLLKKQVCRVLYAAHGFDPRDMFFRPESFQIGLVLRVVGRFADTGEELALQVSGIVRVSPATFHPESAAN